MIMQQEAENLSKKILSPTQIFEDPFKLAYIDDFLPPLILGKLLEGFPPPSVDTWETSHIGEVERKRRTTWKSIYDIPQKIQDVVLYLNSSLFLTAIGQALNIPKLIPDPYFSGGGLNESFDGDYLDVHIDGNFHDATGLNRRANAILYLNPSWSDSWGGCFGMYSQESLSCIRKISPIANRLVFFETSDISLHGFPEPLTLPKGISRKSLILYYYSVAESDKARIKKPHSALWRRHGMRDKSGNITRSIYL